MPTTNRIIFLVGKTGLFELRSDIKSFGYDTRLNKYYVVFKNGDNVLHYNPNKVDVCTFVKQLEPPIRVIRRSDGEAFHHVLGVRVYQGSSHIAYRIVYENGTCCDYSSNYVSIEEHIDDHRSINVWQYLNEVAQYNVIPIDDDKNISLVDKYKRMEFVTKNSLLEAYLNVATYNNNTSLKSTPIFPFGCNRSQYNAVRNALENKLSIIQGPPGTGKTQTILNIMANLLIAGKTMEIVSNNNSAVENVKEKLESVGLEFLCAQLGNTYNKDSFIVKQTGGFPDMTGWALIEPLKVKKEAFELSRSLQALYEAQENLAISRERVSEYEKQLELFPFKYKSEREYSLITLQDFYQICSRDMERKHRLSWLTKLRLRFHRLPYDVNAPEKIQYMLYSRKLSVLKHKQESYQASVRELNSKNERLRDLSMRILKDHIFRIYGSQKVRPVFTKEDLYMKSRLFLKQYPIVLSTTFSATSNIGIDNRFDYLIMDEASQVDIAAGALALGAANNAVIVGDLKQLPNVVSNQTEEIVSSIFAKYSISEAYRYSTNSFLSSLCSLYPSIPQTLLKEHYRCDPLIIGFCSKQFYNGELIPMKPTDPTIAPMRVVRTVKGNHARGNVNLRQVEAVTQEIIPTLEERFSDIGIIAPYNKQVDAINSNLRLAGKPYLAATVHKFQGRENDAIVLSTVDNQIKEFTDDPHLLNVAVSRAKKQFTLVVSADEQPDSNIKDLIDYIEYYQGAGEESKISSIFDLLYEDYTLERVAFFKTHKRVSEHDSENLAYWAIQEVLKENAITNVGILIHYPLRHLITAASGLTEEQYKYASHSWTHLDFLLYDSVTHKAKLAIEVDGTQYHKSNSDQGRRDTMKDAVLETIGLPLLRLSTAGSQEKERIVKAITQS